MILKPDEFRDTFFPLIESAKTYEKFDVMIQAAQAELERQTQVFFEPTKVEDEKHEYYLQDFRQTFWQQQLFEYPIISVDKARIMYNDQVICEFNLDWLVINKKMGTMELLPKAIGEGGFIFSMLLQGMSGFATIMYTGYDRLPCFFHVDYTAGLDFQKLPERDKADLRMAIGRQAAINLLPKLDDRMGISSESTSQDGVSESVSYTASAMFSQYSAQIEQYKKDNAEWVIYFRRKHLKNVAMAVI
jgi:hypothetical protein